MADFPRLLWGTVVLRPYVFAFLAMYIIAGCRHIGWKKTLGFIPVGYSLAWLSEFCSINWGFPYGDYHYIPSTMGVELWVFGVPFMDSLSYVFLSYCSYSLALFIMSPLSFSSGRLLIFDTPPVRRSSHTLILGAFLFVMLDVVIDPVALLGDRWFLGKIYGYRHVGSYFGIPMSNFAGWLVVGLVLVAAQQFLDRVIPSGPRTYAGPASTIWGQVLGPILYLSVMIFNIGVTFRIGENLLGMVDLMILTTLLVMTLFFTSFKLRNTAREIQPPGTALSNE